MYAECYVSLDRKVYEWCIRCMQSFKNVNQNDMQCPRMLQMWRFPLRGVSADVPFDAATAGCLMQEKHQVCLIWKMTMQI